MARFETFDQDIKVATAGLEPDAISAALAKFAKAEIARVVQSGEGSAKFDRFVNGRPGVEEESVVAPGPIVYQFSWWRPVIAFTIDYLISRSPRDSGEYASSHMVLLDNDVVTDPGTIPSGATIMIVNIVPYARKIEVGHMSMSVPAGVYDDALTRVRRQFGTVLDVQKRMVVLPGGYVLRGKFRRGVGRNARKSLRKDTAAGQPVTYPALIMTMKG